MFYLVGLFCNGGRRFTRNESVTRLIACQFNARMKPIQANIVE